MRIAIGIAMFAIAFAVRWSIKVDGFPFITFFPAVLAAGMLGGVSAGAICTVLGLLAARFFFTSASFYLGLNTATSLVPLLLFALAAGVELLLIGLLNRAIDELWLARERSNTLFRELQHRVANNLQFVGALLHLQRKLPLSKDAALSAAHLRLDVMGRIHRKLYDPANADRPVTECLRDLCTDLIQSAGASNVTLQGGRRTAEAFIRETDSAVSDGCRDRDQFSEACFSRWPAGTHRHQHYGRANAALHAGRHR